MICTTKAIVLNNKKFSDSSLICNIYSEESGKIRGYTMGNFDNLNKEYDGGRFTVSKDRYLIGLFKYKEGEKVSIIECKPYSKKKTWQVMDK